MIIIENKSENKAGSRVWELVTNIKHPVTGENLISKEKIDAVLKEHFSIKEYAYILHDKDTYTEEDIQNKKSESIKVGEQKSPHYHIVMRLSRYEPVDKLSNWFGIPENFFNKKMGRNAFFDAVYYLTHQSKKEQAKGKHLYSENEVVCNFIEYDSFHDFIESGETNKEKFGKANLNLKDKLRLMVLYDGTSIRQIKKDFPLAYSDDMEALNKRRGEYLRDAPLPPYRINFYISGAGGAGKGLLSEALARALIDPEGKMSDDEIFCYVGSDSVCFENYDGQPVIIWDDCRHNELFKKLGDRGTVFNVFDTKPKRISQKKKYSQTNLINTINIVNSVEPIDNFLDGLAGQYYDRVERTYVDAEDDQKAQSYRRFPICINVNPKYYDIKTYNSFFGKEGTTVYKCIHAPFKEMVRSLGNDSSEYKKCCLKALKPILELFNQAKEILYQESVDKEDSVDKFEDLGTIYPYKEYMDKHYANLHNYINGALKANPTCDKVNILVNKYCDEYDVTDSELIDFCRCEVEDIVRKRKYN